jgi:hypothetical protein
MIWSDSDTIELAVFNLQEHLAGASCRKATPVRNGTNMIQAPLSAFVPILQLTADGTNDLRAAQPAEWQS